MALVTFKNLDKTVEVAKGTTILQAAREIAVVIESPCNAIGTCGKCKVKLSKASFKNIIQKGCHHISEKEEQEGYVLSCQAEITGDIIIEEIFYQNNKSLKILNHGKSFDIKLNPFIKKEYSNSLDQTVVTGGRESLGVEEGNTVKENYGIVVDIGTTTLVTALVNILNGKEISSVSSLNPQAIHAQDVLSRIKFASDEHGLNIMYNDLIKEINRMIDDLVALNNINKDNIYEVVFSGNTCMLHLATGVSPYSLGKYPYTPEISGGLQLKAADHKINISKFGVIYLPPVISAYVGADITSGILASELKERKGVTLFVDIGTNGEMTMGVNGKISAASTAAGPAFEGMNITFGMRAGFGSIELFNIEEDGSIKIGVIGEGEAVGICGSGLLDIVGELVYYGIINKNGKFIEAEKPDLLPLLKEKLVKQDNRMIFRLTDKIYLTQKDIRQVQLAKGAVRAGIEFLMESNDLKAEDVDEVLIAGSFGYHLKSKSLINIGLLPEVFEDKIEFLGNTSKSGGQAFLLNRTYREKMEELVKAVDVIELANYKDFDKVFVKCLSF